ncbi:MAG TPA: type I-C CRISPR-associated protein Cas8c/Csd1, partial [Candidatus Acidoferrales bacterium]|nr:type I-C CRISPR-associated protein Cas8c/Csd1 [Candidatus Acidoferrales bacterium]
GSDDGKKDRGRLVMAPYAPKSVNINPRLLAENGEYMLGIGRDPGKEDPKVEARHSAFVEAVRLCATKLDDNSLKVVLRFLEKGPVPERNIPENFDARDILTFRVDDELPILLPSVKEYWALAGAPKDGKQLRCLVCNEVKFCPESHPFQVKGIRGGNPTGMAISSANADAFESYGLERSLIAPTCLDCGELAIKALDKLLDIDDHHINVGPVSYIFWCKGVEFNPASFISDPVPGEVRALLESPWKARPAATNVDHTHFYAVALTANNARVVVRDWIDTTVEEAKASLARYFALQKIADPDGSEWVPSTVFALAAATVREAKDLPAHTVEGLLRFIFHGGVLPVWLLFEAVRRNRAEQTVTRSRAALIKLVLLSQDPNFNGGEDMVELDAGMCRPAYLCGRLLAVLDRLQRQAIGQKIDSSVAERFYGAASATPNVVFPTLMRKAEVHFAKLRSQSDPAGYAIRTEVEEILSGLKREFPSVLVLKDQGLFALGYYHQRAHDRAQARERKEQKEAAKAAAAE